MRSEKKYKCEVPDCEKETVIRSRIKTGDYAGLKACPYCKMKFDKKPVKKQAPLIKSKPATIAKRKVQREGLPEFFTTEIKNLSHDPYCMNCGCKINVYLHPVNNIAHILPKRNYPSVMTNEYNVVFLCTEKDHPTVAKSCHWSYDNRVLDRPSMPVFETVIERYKKFREQVQEVGKESLFLDDFI